MPKSDWNKFGSSKRTDTPPPKFKQNVVTEYQSEYGYGIFVETGTYRGDMVYAQLGNFEQIITIELGAALYTRASVRFMSYGHVSVYRGDSGKLLPGIVEALDGPAIFWLDAHYSGGKTALGDKQTPIFKELHAVLSDTRYDHVILIDDARSFNGKNDFPLIPDVAEYVNAFRPQGKFTVEDDIIRSVV